MSLKYFIDLRIFGILRLSILTVSLGLVSFSLQAQISHGGEPASFRMEKFAENESVYRPKTSFSIEKYAIEEKQCTAYEFGKILPFDQKLKNPNFGTKKIDRDGNIVWKAVISSKNAEALGLYFSDFYLPKGAKLFVYSPNKEQIIGSFTEQNNSKTGMFATELIFGDKLIIEYNEPANVAGLGHFTIDEVLHAFRGVNDLKESNGFRDSGSCEINVACSEGTGYEKQINSVVRLSIKEGGSSYWCTGSVINNVENDRTPYVLTADHCASDASTSDLNQWIIYFNYQSTTCANPTIEPVAKTMVGATKIAASSNAGILGSDFYLVELQEDIPVEYNAYFMGWERTGDGSTNGVSIHHPQGDIKKISTYTSDLLSATYTSGGYVGLTNGSWEVVWAETLNGHGVTEGGSSGSPIYSQDGYLIGTLTGGWAACDNLTAEDYYGKFDYHWDKNGSTNNTQLKPWLDPNNTGVLFLSGVPVGIEEELKIQESFFNLFPNPSNGQIVLRFDQSAYGKNYSIRVSNMLGQAIYQDKLAIDHQLDLNLQHLQAGVYFLEIEGENQRQTQKISIY
jgi:hypothetical protein